MVGKSKRLGGLGRKQQRKVGPGAKRRADELFNRARQLQLMGQAGQAKEALLACLQENPAHAVGLHQLGLHLRAEGELAQAVALLEKAVAIDTDEPTAWNNLGNLLVDLGRPADALGKYRQALKLDGRYVSAHYNLAKALQQSGRPGQAVTHFEAAQALLPGEAQIAASLGAALLEDGRSDAALLQCERAVTLAPQLAEGHNNLGLVRLARAAFDAAAQSFRQALDRDPDYAAAAANLTRTRRFADASDPDILRIEELLARGPVEPQVEVELRFALGKAYDDTNDFERAIGHYLRGNTLKRQTVQFDRARHRQQTVARIQHYDAALYRNRAAREECSEALPVFIVGMPRSGTSLVEQILAAHPAIFGAGELPDIGLIEQELATGSMDFSWVEQLEQPVLDEQAARYLRKLEARAGADARRVVDKTPTNFLNLGLIALLFPGARVIHCRRDRRDCGLSIFFRHFTGGHGYAYDLGDIRAFHDDYVNLMAHWADVALPLQMLHVSYEELVADLEGQARGIIEFCALPWHSACLNFHQVERTVYTASVWQVRQPVYQRSVGRWKHYAAYLDTLWA